MSTLAQVLSTAATLAPFIEKVADHIHNDGPEPEGLATLPEVTKSAISLERMRVRMEKAEVRRNNPGSGT